MRKRLHNDTERHKFYLNRWRDKYHKEKIDHKSLSIVESSKKRTLWRTISSDQMSEGTSSRKTEIVMHRRQGLRTGKEKKLWGPIFSE